VNFMCAAAVAYAPKEPLSFEDILVAPPQAGEVRVKITHSSICQSDLYILLGKVNIKYFPEPSPPPPKKRNRNFGLRMLFLITGILSVIFQDKNHLFPRIVGHEAAG
jgi:Zn-dependent alcohol dehydrogenase